MAYRGKPNGGRDNRQQREPRTNRRIRVREVRVIASDGEQLGVLATEVALRRAMDEGLDLVEISPTARPPVCKIMDLGRYKYEQKRKATDAKKRQHQIEVKEVKFRPKTDVHDFDVKVARVKRFIEKGNKCKVTIMFRGREIVHPNIGREMLARVADDVKEMAQIELRARMEGRQMFMILTPIKKAADQKPAKAARPPQVRTSQVKPVVAAKIETPTTSV